MKELKNILDLLLAGSSITVAIVLCSNISPTDSNWVDWILGIASVVLAIVWIRIYLKEE